MTELKRTEESTRTLKIHLNGKLEFDSNNVDYNLRGTVIDRDFVERVEVNRSRENDTHILILPSNVYVGGEVLIAQNSGEECVKLFRIRPYTFILLPTKHIEMIELTETKKIILVP